MVAVLTVFLVIVSILSLVINKPLVIKARRFVSLVLFFNLPVRVFMETSLDLLIIATQNIKIGANTSLGPGAIVSSSVTILLVLAGFGLIAILGFKKSLSARFGQLSDGLVVGGGVASLHNLLFVAVRLIHTVNASLTDEVPALAQTLVYCLTVSGFWLMLVASKVLLS